MRWRTSSARCRALWSLGLVLAFAAAPAVAAPDVTPPTAPTVTGGSLAWQAGPLAITAAGSIDAESGLAGYERRTSTDSGLSWSPPATGASLAVSADGETLVQFRSVDNAANVSAWTPAVVDATNTARVTSQRGTDLATAANVFLRIDGEVADDQLGEQGIAAVGDVNADGRPDIVVGSWAADKNGRTDSGSVYVIFGRATPGVVDLASLGAGGFRIDGPAAYGAAGYVRPAGDVNGDGRADILVAGPFLEIAGRGYPGSAYVVFGTASTTTIDLAALGPGGYRILGASDGDELIRFANAGDVNGDGTPDQLLAARRADFNGRLESGSVYVLWGKATTTDIDLAALGSGGYRIDGEGAGDWFGNWVAGAGDVNGDGTPDALIGARIADGTGGVDSGRAYVVWGKSSTTTVDTAALGSAGYRIEGAAAGDNVGFRVANAGDVNGDGRPDQIVSAPYASPLSRASGGSVYVLWGKSTPTTIDLATLGSAGFRIDGPSAGAEAGRGGVTSVGDVSGDGRPDIFIGLRGVGMRGRVGSGAGYMVYAHASNGSIDLRTLPTGGVRVDGAAAGDALGTGVDWIDDLNGDGRGEMLVAAAFADNNGRVDSGSAYVVAPTLADASATTGTATAITATEASLNGTVNPEGTVTTRYFEWGTTSAYGNATPVVAAGSGATGVAVSATVTGLSEYSTYHYRVVATNVVGTVTRGADQVVTTADVTSPTTPTLAGGSLLWRAVASVDVRASGSTDGGTGLAGYEWSTSGDAGTVWTTPTFAIVTGVSADGETLVRFRAVDLAGNRSAWALTRVRLTRTASDGTTPNPAGTNAAFADRRHVGAGQPVTFSVSSTFAPPDAVITWRFSDGQTASGRTATAAFAQAGTITAVAVVTASGEAPVETPTSVVVDTTAPAATLTLTGRQLGIALVDDTDGAGIDSGAVTLGRGSALTVGATATTHRLAEGRTRVLVVATDLVGNRSETRQKFLVDTRGPQITVLAPRRAIAPARVRVKAQDRYSGLRRLVIDKKRVKAKRFQWVRMKPGRHVVVATDKRGNRTRMAFTIRAGSPTGLATYLKPKGALR